MKSDANGRASPAAKLPLMLLGYCAAQVQQNTEPADALSISELTAAQVEWALRAGLGALLYHASNCQLHMPGGESWRKLVSVELTSRIRYALIVDTTLDVLDACEQVGASPTLLKGVSISDQCYPTPHVRTMGDVDLLIHKEAYEPLEELLLSRGYRRSPHRPPDGYHGYPLFNARNQVWVELHLELFPKDSGLVDGTTFCRFNIDANSIDAVFHGKHVKRLGNELQLAYISSSWIRDLTINGISPGFLTPLIDVLYLQKYWQEMNGTKLLDMLDNELARSSVYVMTSYLARHRFRHAPILAELARRERLLHPVELLAMHLSLDHYLLAGREWNLPLPLPVPGRYNFGRQFRKRFRLTRTRTAP